jgi:O-succinylbenzoic acid--CoA ligase
MTNASDWLSQRAQISPEQTALIWGQQAWTYGQLHGLVGTISRQLTAADIDAGSHIAVLMPNQVAYVCLIHALARLGAVLVPLNVRLTPDELRWQVEQAECSTIICAAETEAQTTALATPGRRLISVDPPTRPGVKALDEFAETEQSGPGQPLDLDAVQGIVFTSGTTGRPKGTMLTFGNHFWSATASAFRLGTDPADRWLVCMPLYHVGGIAIIFRCCLYGTTVVLQSGFEPTAVIGAIDSHGLTLISVVPTMLARLLESHGHELASAELRCILLGGAAAPESLLESSRALDLPVATTYGLTEAASQVATAPAAAVQHKPGSVGKPLMFSRVRIIGQNGQALPNGEIGEIVVRGPTVMKGYFKDTPATAKSLVDDELRTGDMGFVDVDGDLWVVQRRADLIISGGENVYPAEVERVLAQYPGVAEVCVVGVDDETWGQRVAAAVVTHGTETPVTEQELVGYSREHLAGYKCPCRLRFVDALPRTASGKVIREQVKSLMASWQVG